MKPICFFDLETTGTDKSNDRIIEIAIAKVLNDEIIDRFYSFINPGIAIPQAAIDVHGITDEQVKDAPKFNDLAPSILSFISDCDLGGYNSNSFDIPFLYIEMNRAGIPISLDGVRFFDACNIFKRMEERTLSAAHKFYLGVPHENAHSAMDDVLATINVFNRQRAHYPEIMEMDFDKLALFCNYDRPRCDISGNFQIDADGDHVLTFGKHRGRKAKEVKDYLLWMLGSDFLPDTKSIIKSILKN